MDSLTIKIDRQWAAQLRRKCKNIHIEPRILLDLTGEMLLASLKNRNVATKSPKGRIRAVGKDDHMTEEFEMSKHVAQKLHPYLMFFDLSLSRLINDALAKMQPNIVRILPINCRSMGCLRQAMFLIENGRDPMPHKSAEALAEKKAKEAIADRKERLKKDLGPEEGFDVVIV